MNKKYNYLIEYLQNNINKSFEDCEIFDYQKFSIGQNVDYIYFFVISDQRKEYIIDSENIQSIDSFTTNEYEEIETNYPIYTGEQTYIPVISSSELPNIVFRNVNKFYALRIAKLPIKYWKIDPAINNYNKLIKNTINNNDIFEYIEFENINENIFNDSIDYSMNNVDLKDTVLINTHTGKISNQTLFTDITWTDLELQEHNKAVREVIEGGSIEYPTAEQQNNNIISNESIQRIINSKNDNAYTNTYARTSHTIYNPYVFNISGLNWYSWMNFINNQYDNGVLITEYSKNIKNLYNIYASKYINTFIYPKIVFKDIPYYQIPNIVHEDPVWKNTENKIEYLYRNCRQIGNYWYTNDTLLQVCCEHVRCELMKTPYPKGLIIREEGQEICGNCCELIGNYNDDNAFVEGMNEINTEGSINYKWRDNQDIKSAEYSWNNLKSYIEAIDPTFINNITFVNRFIQIYHNHDYNKKYLKYGKSQFDYKAFNKSIIDTIIYMYNKKELINSKNIFRQAVSKYINNDFIIKKIREIRNDEQYIIYLQENNTNINVLQKLYKESNDTNIKNLLAIAITNCKVINIITEKCDKYFKYEIRTAQRNKRSVNLSVITNFFKNITKKSQRFIKLLSVIVVVIKIKCEASKLNEYSFDFNDINWNILFKKDNEYNELTVKDSQRDILFNLHSFENNPNGRFICMYLNTNNINEYISNSSIVTWINKFFNAISPNIKITISHKGKKISYNNSVFEKQQLLIDTYYDELSKNNFPLLANTNNIIVNNVVDIITCPDILTRKFNSKMSFQQLCKSDFPTADEYLIDKRNNNIIFNEDTKLMQFYYIDIIKDINDNFIKPLEDALFNNIPTNKDRLIDPSTYFNEKFNEWLIFIKTVTSSSANFTNYNNYLQNLIIPNECEQTYEQIRDFVNEVEVGINNLEKLIESLNLIIVNDKPNENYKQLYNNINPFNYNQNQRFYVDVKIQICRRLIQWYMICIFAENIMYINNIVGINKYIILRNSIDNFHNYIFTNKIPYTIIKYNCTNDEKLIDMFINEFFNYNNMFNNIDILQVFFKDLRINTQLFISPDNYIDSNVKTKRYIKRAGNLRDFIENQELDLQELDNEEQGNERPKRNVNNDNIDFLHLPEIELEVLTQNELIGGEIDDMYIDDEDMY